MDDSDANVSNVIAAYPTGAEGETPYRINSHFSAKTDSSNQIALATACVKIRSNSGRTLIVRALVDQGSELTFLSESVAQILRLT